MPDYSDSKFNLLLRCHGITDINAYNYWQPNANFAEFRRHTLPFRQHFSISMALHSPQPHSWCWFCHSFGRFNCLLFQILHPRNAAIHPIPTTAPTRRELTQPVPMYVRQSARTIEAPPVPATPQGYSKFWEYQPVTASTGAQMPPKQQQADVDSGNSNSKKTETIGYYQLEIRQNVVNIPPNLNRFIPYHIPDASNGARAEEGKKLFSKDSNYCDLPPFRRHGNNHGMNSIDNGQGSSLYY